MTVIRRDGYRMSEGVLEQSAERAQALGVRSGELLDEAKKFDREGRGHKYLDRGEFNAAIQSLERPSYEQILGASPREFRAFNRRDLEGKLTLPTYAALTFEASSGASEAAKTRDARMDAVAHKLVERLSLLPGWSASVVGAEDDADLAGGRLKLKWDGPDDRSYGEAFNRIHVDVPGVGPTSLAFTWMRSAYGGHAVADEKPDLSLSFVDEDTHDLMGSGYGLPSDVLTEKDPQAVAAKTEALVSHVVGLLEEFKRLNDGSQPSTGVG